MKNQLEKFIKDNRDEFDAYEPDAKVWRNIQKSMKPQSRIKPIDFNWRIAAAIATPCARPSLSILCTFLPKKGASIANESGWYLVIRPLTVLNINCSFL